MVQYLQQACHTGRLRLMLTSLQTSGFGAQPAWAEFHTRNSVLGDPPRLALAGTAVQQTDSDGDGLPDDWERHVSGSLAHGPADDTDGDGLPASAEWEAGTDPHNPAEVLRASLLPAHSIGNPRLRFRYAPSRHYTLGVSTNLHTWESLPRGPIAHEPGSPWATLELPSISPATTVFFRVHATPAPTTPP